jgi:hypothetical protein
VWLIAFPQCDPVVWQIPELIVIDSSCYHYILESIFPDLIAPLIAPVTIKYGKSRDYGGRRFTALLLFFGKYMMDGWMVSGRRLIKLNGQDVSNL